MQFAFLFLALTSFASDNIQVRETLKKQMTRIMEDALICMPRKEKLCTGVSFNAQELKTLQSLSLLQCQKELQKKNFRLVFGDALRKFPDFLNSTMRAQTIFETKLVLYKKDQFNRIDCIHELLHVYQHDPAHIMDLSPTVRKNIEEKFLKHLNAGIAEVEAAEKNKDATLAKHLGAIIQQDISFLKTWKDMNSWLDEKDIHYFILQNCEYFKCTELDRDIAVSNLYKLIRYIPQEEAGMIRKEAAILLQNKEEKALIAVKARWKETTFPQEELKYLLTLSWEELLGRIKKDRIQIQRVETSVRINGLDVIPPELYDRHALAARALTQDSKLSLGQAFAKYIPEASGNLILITPITTKVSLVHEYMHFLQARNNTAYRDSLQEAPALMSLFLSGKMSREKYEERALLANAMSGMGEKEVYSVLLKLKDSVPQLEHQNNLEMFEFYNKKLKLPE